MTRYGFFMVSLTPFFSIQSGFRISRSLEAIEPPIPLSPFVQSHLISVCSGVRSRVCPDSRRTASLLRFNVRPTFIVTGMVAVQHRSSFRTVNRGGHKIWTIRFSSTARTPTEESAGVASPQCWLTIA